MAKKQSGLGADALFPAAQPVVSSNAAEPAAQTEKGMRTTVMLPTSVVVLLSRLREQSVLNGARQTQGEIIAAAIVLLAEREGVKSPEHKSTCQE